ncbi:hypothetical protein K461DRAFT_291377 [Myriangium duriaei CBS 260.36]|uniref:GDP-mannose transporter n=1 Tax=Myriangium duriaei CBS 260.36 TaxID=1168546 RepID=A0A9P4MKP5_9PEZI|nr:hypothetical protein K461DRAFT_291377 [Myriangium duriaei CBS 260.36]
MANPRASQDVNTSLDVESEKGGLLSSETRERADSLIDEAMGVLQLKDEESGVRSAPDPPRGRPSSLLFWISVNIISTVAIVFINKSIFAAPSFNQAQFIFASYHFILTYLLLSLLSSAHPLLVSIKQFERRHASVVSIFPLAASMSLSVTFLNTSLAFCSVPFYQTVRVLLTPVVAAINYLFFAKSIPSQAAFMLIPTCAGVGFMAYSDTKGAAATGGQTTSLFGAFFALTGVFISSIYTVWIGTYHRKLDMSSTQLLHSQSLLGGFMLAVAGVLSGKIPDFAAFDTRMWQMMFLSGLCATFLNLSQFRVIAMAGPVAGTVVGHVKTITIVLLGWSISGKAVNQGSIIGIVVAIAGIIAYTAAEKHYGRK